MTEEIYEAAREEFDQWWSEQLRRGSLQPEDRHTAWFTWLPAWMQGHKQGSGNKDELLAALDEWQRAYDEARENAGPYTYALEEAFEETARRAYAALGEQEAHDA